MQVAGSLGLYKAAWTFLLIRNRTSVDSLAAPSSVKLPFLPNEMVCEILGHLTTWYFPSATYLQEIESADAHTNEFDEIRDSLRIQAIPYLKRSLVGKQNALQIARLSQLEGTLPCFASAAEKDAHRKNLAPFKKIVDKHAEFQRALHYTV